MISPSSQCSLNFVDQSIRTLAQDSIDFKKIFQTLGGAHVASKSLIFAIFCGILNTTLSSQDLSLFTEYLKTEAIDKEKLMPVFDAEALEFWEENGYVVVQEAVPLENCRAAEQAVWDFLEMDRDDPESWYPDPPRRSIMVEIYQHQALWNNRQYPRVHQAFSEIWDTEKLWVSFDRASMNPPERPDYTFTGPYLHWDMSLDNMPVRLKVQGVLYLADTPGNQGAFTCIPGFHRKLESWLNDLPDDANPREVVRDYQAEAVPVAGKAGDLVIWHSALPHGSSPNSAVRPEWRNTSRCHQHQRMAMLSPGLKGGVNV